MNGTGMALHGLFAGTLVAAERGWQPVEDLAAGDRVWTFDGGLQRIRSFSGGPLAGDRARPATPPVVVSVPPNALGNSRELLFPEGQGLLLRCENARDASGDPYAVVPVEALEGLFGIRRRALPTHVALYDLMFAEDEALYIDSGLMALCKGPDKVSMADLPARYNVLSTKAARQLLTDLDLAELALREPSDAVFHQRVADRYG